MKNKILLLAIILSQVLLIVFWGSRRENFYWDEYYTFEKTHYISQSTVTEHYIDQDPEYKYHTWLPISFVNSTLSVTMEESIINDSPVYIFKKIVGPHSYFVFLNVIEAIFFDGQVTLWGAIALNIILFIILQLVLYLLTFKISKQHKLSILVVSFYGFSSVCISMAIFARFYVFAALMVVLFVLFHYFYWITDDNEHLKRLLFLFFAFVFLYFGYKNAQFVIVYGAFFSLGFSVLLIPYKGMKRFACYSVPIYGGGLLYIYHEEYLDILINPREAYDMAEGAMAWAIEQMIEFRLAYLPERMLEMGKNFGRYLFGSFFVMLIVVVIVLARVILKKLKTTDKMVTEVEKPSDNGFMLAVLLSLIIFFAFFTAFRLYEQIRYVSYAFPLCALVVVWAVYKVFDDKKKAILMIVAMIVLQILSVNVKGKVDMIYKGDRERIEQIRALDAKSLMLYAGYHTEHITYQSTLFVDNDAEFFVYDGESIDEAEQGIRDDMLVVMYNGSHDEEFEKMLSSHGFDLEQVGWTYELSVYKLVKQG